jgi:hypothetical protein
VFRTAIRLHDQADISALIKDFRVSIAGQGLELTMAADQVEQVIQDFHKQGAKLAQIGSQFEAGRTIKGTDFEINIKATYGRKRSLIERLLGR